MNDSKEEWLIRVLEVWKKTWKHRKDHIYGQDVRCFVGASFICHNRLNSIVDMYTKKTDDETEEVHE